MTAVVLSLILVMQMVFTTGIMQKSVKAIDSEKGLKLESYEFKFPEGTTKDHIVGGTTFTINFKIKNESDDELSMDDRGFAVTWNYTENENGQKHELTSTKAEFKGENDDSYSSIVYLKSGETCNVKVQVPTNAYWKTGKAVLKELCFIRYNDPEMVYGYEVDDNGRLNQKIYYIYNWSASVDYDGGLDFAVQESDVKDTKKPTITNIKKVTTDPIYSSGKMEYDIDYKDDLSGVQKAELTFANGESEVTFNGNVEEEKSCNGTMRVSKSGEDKAFKVGTYKLKEAKITDYSDKTTTYTLNQSGTKLTGNDADEDTSASEIDPCEFQVKYMDKGLIISNLQFNDTDPEKEIQEYPVKKKITADLTLKNTTDEAIEIDTNKFTMSLSSERASMTMYYENRNDIVTIDPREEKTFKMEDTVDDEYEGQIFTLKSIDIWNPYGDVLVWKNDSPGEVKYKGDAIKLDNEIKPFQLKIIPLSALDKEAPHLTSVSVPDKNEAPGWMMLTLGIDQETLGYARPDKVYVELEDTKRPKNVLKFDKDILYKDGENGKYEINLRLDENTMGSTYKIRTLTIIDENNNKRTYRMCEDGKLGVSENGETGKKGTIDSPDIIITNDTDPVDDFDGPVLKDIQLEKFMYEDSESIYINGTVKATDENGISKRMELELINGDQVSRTKIDSLWPTENENEYSVRFDLTFDEIPHGKQTLYKLHLYDDTSRQNESVYTYNAKTGEFQRDNEKVKAKGESQFTVHNYRIWIDKATPEKDGMKVKSCMQPGCDIEEDQRIEKTISHPTEISMMKCYMEAQVQNKKPYFTIMGVNHITADDYEVVFPSGYQSVGKHTIVVNFKGDYYAGSMTKDFYVMTPIYLKDFQINKEKIQKDEEFKVTVQVDAQKPLSSMDFKYSYCKNDGSWDDAVLKSKSCEAINETTYTFTYDTKELEKAFKGYYNFKGVILYDKIGNVEGVEYDYMTNWGTVPTSYQLYAVRAGDMIPGYDLGDFYTDENSRIEIPEVRFDIESDDDSNEDPQPPVHNHTFKKVTVKASPGKDGKTYERCDECGATRNDKTISAPKTITLSSGSYTYNGKKQTPKVKITAKNDSTISASNYTVTYPYSKNAGRYNVVVKFKGNYTGQMSKTFDILPKATKLSKVTAGKKKATVSWAKQTTQTSGYQLQYSLSNKFKSGNKTATISKNKTTKTTIKSLKSKKKYYVRIRTYTKVKYNGKYITLYSGWSGAKSVKIK